LLQVLVLSVVEDWVVDDDPIDGGVVVGRHDRLLDVVLRDGLQGVCKATSQTAQQPSRVSSTVPNLEP
jgi:hypothetical protein